MECKPLQKLYVFLNSPWIVEYVCLHCIVSELFYTFSILGRIVLTGIANWFANIYFGLHGRPHYICFSQKPSTGVGDNLLTNLCNETADYMMVSPLDKWSFGEYQPSPAPPPLHRKPLISFKEKRIPKTFIQICVLLGSRKLEEPVT